MLTQLLISMDMQNSMRIITDMAFNSIDLDGSDSLDVTEIKDMMDKIADEIGISPPTLDDLEAIIKEIDDDFDGQISKDEFFKLVMLIIEKLVETEMELCKKGNEAKQKAEMN